MEINLHDILLPINMVLAAGFLLVLARLWKNARTERLNPISHSPEDSLSNGQELLLKIIVRIRKVRERLPLSQLDLQDEAHNWVLKSLLPGLLLTGAVLLYLGQAMLPVPLETRGWISWLFIAVGFLLFFSGASGFSRRRFPAVLAGQIQKAASSIGITPFQLQLLAAAPFLSYAASRLAGFQELMHRPWFAAAAWITALLFLILGTLKLPLRVPGSGIPRWEAALILVILAVSAFLRIHDLESIPWVLTGDEGSAGLSAVRFLSGEQNNLFNTGWFAFPSLFFFMQSLPIRILGNTVPALRMSSAVIGSLAILATYWAVRPAFGRWAALFASAYLAAFHFHIHFSRIGLNNIWDSLFFTLAFGAAIRLYLHRRSFDAAFLGLSIGLCQYFYSSSRVLIILAVAWLIPAALLNRKNTKENHGSSIPFGAGVALAALALITAVLPLALFYIEFPNDFLAPYQRVKLMDSGSSVLSWNRLSEMLPKLQHQFTESLKAFTGTNLRMWYNSSEPMLLTLPAALFLLGLAVMLLRLSDPAVIWVLLWLASAVGVSMFSQDAPAPQRLPYTAPAVSIVIALSVHQVSGWLSEQWPRFKRWTLGAAGVLILISMTANIHYYFFDHLPSHDFGDLNTEVAYRVSMILQEKPDQTMVYFLGGRMGYYSHNSISYVAPQCKGVDLFDPIQEPLDLNSYRETVFIILPEREQEILTLAEMYPEGEQWLHYSENDEILFFTYTVPPTY